MLWRANVIVKKTRYAVYGAAVITALLAFSPYPSHAQSLAGMSTDANGNLQLVTVQSGYAQSLQAYTQNKSTGAWSGPTSIPSPSNVGLNYVWLAPGNAGNLQAIALATTGLPYLSYLAVPTWSSYGQLPDTNNTQLSAITTVHGNGNLQVVGVGQSNGLRGAEGIAPYLIWQSSSTGTWTWYGQLPNGGGTPPTFQALAAGIGNSGNAQVILLGSDGLPYLLWQNSATGNWAWASKLPVATGITFATLATGTGNQGNLQVILVGANDGLPYLIWQNNATGTWTWGGQLPDTNSTKFNIPYAFESQTIATGQQTVSSGQGSNNNLQVVLLDTNQLPELIWQDGSGTWHWSGKLPDTGNVTAKTIAVGQGNGNNLQVILANLTGAPYLIWQNNTTGAWSWFGQLP
jgi:hypothetical protein